MTKHNFSVEYLTDVEMDRVARNLEDIDELLKSQKYNPKLPTEYKEVLSRLMIIDTLYASIVATLIVEIDNLKKPWWKRLFR